MSLISKLYRGLSSRMFSRIVLVTLLCLSFLFLPYVRPPQTTHASVVGRTPSANGTLSGPGSGLVGWWTFDGKDVVNGVIRDMSGNGNNGTPINIASSTFYAPGKIGQAGKFRGTDEKINVTNPISNYSNPNSGCVWVKPMTLTGNPGVYNFKIDSNNLVSLFLVGGGGYVVSYKAGGVDYTKQNLTSSNIKLNTWSHICYVFDGTNRVILYTNAAVPSSQQDNIAFTAGLNNSIGDAISTYLSGSIDDVRIYNRALSATEVQQLYNLGSAKVNVTPTKNTDINTGMLGWWTFDGKNTTAVVTNDTSGKGLTATLQEAAPNLPKMVAGRVGQALSFDGVYSYATILSNPLVSAPSTMSTPNSICTWAYLVNPSLNGSGAWEQTIFNFMTNTSNGVRLSNDFTSGGAFVASYRVGGTFYGAISSTIVFKPKTWTHVCYTWNGTSITLYANGSVLTSSASSNPIGAANVIGARDDLYNGMWNGSVDDIRVYSRTLTPAEVREIYNQGAGTMNKSPAMNTSATTGLSAGLVGWWTFDGKDTIWTGQTAGTVIDKSGNGNTGTLTNMNRTTSPVIGKVGQALKFINNGTYIPVGTTGMSASSGSLSVWFNASFISNSGGNYNYIYVMDNAGQLIYLYLYQNALSARLGTTVNLTETGTVSLNKWYLGTLTWNSGIYTFYVNGTAQGSGSYLGLSAVAASANISMNNSEGFAGSIDDLRIYNRALSATEVAQLYNMGSDGKYVVAPPPACGSYTVTGPDGLTYGTVLGADGRCWLDRNLGATRVATAQNDAQSYGVLYQWGRGRDGHQATTSALTSTLSTLDQPGHGNFITNGVANFDWKTNATQNNTLWSGVGAVNNPCPTGFRLPTGGATGEWKALTDAAVITNSATAFSSSLKLPLAGYRGSSSGGLSSQGSFGFYWSSSVTGTYAFSLFFYSSSVDPADYNGRAYGFSVRCLKD